ncbi:MAG: NADH:ubiquinone oxidoreductase subunit NDUFA12 [Alphaproteobacteria bacterium]|nr:MAG: NADH:ubiquinone oxidoreductase subunit NDUFA12 [Alphaproteobacteria bacterium]
MLKNIFLKIFTWWNGATVGTLLFTWRHGVLVGKDDQGNRYYRTKDGQRRWVIYNGEAEASRIPPEWHRWIHFTADAPPSEDPPVVKPWEKPHMPNPTGTPAAYFPPGSLHRLDREKVAPKPHYRAWRPDEGAGAS